MKDQNPLATALHNCHKNGDDKTKAKVRELIELMRKASGATGSAD